MSRKHFQTKHDAGWTRHARLGTPEPDVNVGAVLSRGVQITVRPERFRDVLARQIRQDIWRKLAAVRGLLPIVTVTGGPGTGSPLKVEAGAVLTGKCPASAYVRSVLEQVLNDPILRRRWLQHAEQASRC
ncbi:MAG: hypothetical protein AAGB10_04955 [Pseudomonadota bacterium]